MKSAKIEDGLVTNVAVGVAEGHIACPDGVEIGWRHDGSGFTPPPPVAPPSDAERAAQVSLSRSDFFEVWRTAAALQAEEPRIVEWTIRQIEASSLPAAAKALYAERVETATSFPRVDPELGDVMTTLGAVFGLSSSDVDGLFLGRSVAVDRADCPIAGPVTSRAAELAALIGRIEVLEAAS